MSPSRYSISTDTFGTGSRGQAYLGHWAFDDTPSLGDLPNAVISGISIRYARLVDSLHVRALKPVRVAAPDGATRFITVRPTPKPLNMAALVVIRSNSIWMRVK